MAHGAIVALFGLSWWTAEADAPDWHRFSGCGLLAVLVFRFYWGWVGSETSRFRSFVRGPRAVLRYAGGLFERGSPGTIGHNPLAGWGALLLLGALAVQIALGLFAVDVDGVDSGPLSRWVSFGQGRRLADWHQTGFEILLALIALHLCAVLFYRVWRGEDLLRPMLGGEKLWRGPAAPEPRFASARLALLGVALSAACVAALWAVASGLLAG